jgi:hypothetical protein
MAHPVTACDPRGRDSGRRQLGNSPPLKGYLRGTRDRQDLSYHRPYVIGGTDPRWQCQGTRLNSPSRA